MPSNFNRMYSNSMALISWLTWGGVVERQRPGPMERSQGPMGVLVDLTMTVTDWNRCGFCGIYRRKGERRRR